MISISPRQAATPYFQVIVQCYGPACPTAESCELHFLKATKFPALIHAIPEKEWLYGS